MPLAGVDSAADPNVESSAVEVVGVMGPGVEGRGEAGSAGVEARVIEWRDGSFGGVASAGAGPARV